jgi:hypothetical protein
LPALVAGISEHQVEISVYDLKGSVVAQLAKGKYRAGHYSLVWSARVGGPAASNVFILRMRAAGFDRRIKLVKMGE